MCIGDRDVDPAPDSDGTDGRWRIARATAPDRVISTVDPDTRHAHKTRERRQDGFKAHVVVEPDTGLTTMCEPVSYTHLRAHETVLDLVCRLLLEKKKNKPL